jgi:hypothetical protein
VSIWGSSGLKVGTGDAVDEVVVDGKGVEVEIEVEVVTVVEVVDGVQVLVEDCLVVDGKGVDVVEVPPSP